MTDAMTDAMTGALYVLFSTTFFQPREPGAYEALVEAGLALSVAQGQIAGYRISPAGYLCAMGLWGHRQVEERRSAVDLLKEQEAWQKVIVAAAAEKRRANAWQSRC